MSQSQDPSGALVAAEVAIGEDDLDTAEDAVLEALSRIRQAKEEHDE
jgi:hypothetical protein